VEKDELTGTSRAQLNTKVYLENTPQMTAQQQLLTVLVNSYVDDDAMESEFIYQTKALALEERVAVITCEEYVTILFWEGNER